MLARSRPEEKVGPLEEQEISHNSLRAYSDPIKMRAPSVSESGGGSWKTEMKREQGTAGSGTVLKALGTLATGGTRVRRRIGTSENKYGFLEDRLDRSPVHTDGKGQRLGQLERPSSGRQRQRHQASG